MKKFLLAACFASLCVFSYSQKTYNEYAARIQQTDYKNLDDKKFEAVLEKCMASGGDAISPYLYATTVRENQIDYLIQKLKKGLKQASVKKLMDSQTLWKKFVDAETLAFSNDQLDKTGPGTMNEELTVQHTYEAYRARANQLLNMIFIK